MGRGVRRELQLGLVNQMLTKLARDVARNLKIVVAHWNETSDDNPWSIRVESGCNIATIMKCQSIVENQRNGQSNRPVDAEFVKRIVTHAVNGRETSVWKMRRRMLDNQEWANEDYSVIFFRLVRVSAYADALISGTDTGQPQPFCAVKLMVEHAKQLGYVIAHKSEPFVDQMAQGPVSMLSQMLPTSVFDGLDGSETCFGARALRLGGRARRKEPKQRGPNGHAFGRTEDEKSKRKKELEAIINDNKNKCYPVYVTRDANESGENRYCLAMSMMAIDQQVLLEVRGVQLREERVGSGGGVVLYRPLESMRRLMYEASSKRHVFLEKVDTWKEAHDTLIKYIGTLKTEGYDKINEAVGMCYCDNAAVTKMKIEELQEHSDLVTRLMQLKASNALLVSATKGEDNLIDAMDGALTEVGKVYAEYTNEVGMKEAWSHAARDVTNSAKDAYISKRTEYINGLKLYVTNASEACALFLALQTAMINQHNVSEALLKFEKEEKEATTRVTEAGKVLTEAKRILALSLAEKEKADAALVGQPQDVEAQAIADAIHAKHKVLVADEKAAQKRQEEAQAALVAATENKTQTSAQKTEAENAVTVAQTARAIKTIQTALNVDYTTELDEYKKALDSINTYLEGRTKAIDAHIAKTHAPNSQKSEYVLQKEEKAHVLGEAFRIKVTQRDPVFFAVQVSGELFRLVDAVTTRPDNFRNKKGRKGIEDPTATDPKSTPKVTAEEEDYKKCVATAGAYFELYIGRKNTDLRSPYRWELGPLRPAAAAAAFGSALAKPDVTRLLIVPYGLVNTGSGTDLPLYDMTVYLHRSGIYIKKEAVGSGSIACAWCGKNVTAKTKEELEEVYAPRAHCAASDENIIGGLASLCNVGKCKHDAADKGAAATVSGPKARGCCVM